MRYRTIDGQYYSGRTARYVVSDMANDKLTTVRNRKSYMRATARRVKAAYNADIRADSTYQHFLDDLEEAGLLKRLD